MKTLSGVVCATITPMRKNGEIDEESLRSLLNHLAGNGIDGIYPNGTNGEGILLSARERRRAAEILVSENKGRMSVYIQCGSAATEEAVSHARHSREIGADGIGIMTPLFFHCDDQALSAYYDEILSAVPDFPAYIYNIPSHTRNDVTPGLLAQLMARHDNLRGIKYSDYNLPRAQDYLRQAPRPADLLVGCDSLFLQCLMTGGVGTVSGPAMVFAKRFVRLYRQYRERDFEGAMETQRRIVDTDRALSGIPSIPAIKAMLKMLGVIKEDICRGPLRPLTAEEYGAAEKVLNAYCREEG